MALSGPAPLSREDMDALEESSRDQDTYFDRFLMEVLANPPAEIEARFLSGIMSAPQVIARFGKYGADIWCRGVNWLRGKMRRKAATGAGGAVGGVPAGATLIEERRLLEPHADHCSECPELAGMGWVPVGTLAGIGGCECRENCRCKFKYREVPMTSAIAVAP